jgi:hypothetical protein
MSQENTNEPLCKTAVISRYPWVFWIRFEKRDWFCNFWKSRGSNCLDIHIFKLHISIGMPWHKEVLRKADVNHPLELLSHRRKVNETFTKWYHLQIGSYNGL